MKNNTTGSITRDLELAQASEKADMQRKLARLGPISMFCFRTGYALMVLAMIVAQLWLAWNGVDLALSFVSETVLPTLGIVEGQFLGVLWKWLFNFCAFMIVALVAVVILDALMRAFETKWHEIWLPPLQADDL